MEPRALARHLARCAAAQRDPVFASADAKLWFLALGHLLTTNSLEAAAFAAPRLVRAFPSSASFRRTALMLKTLPPAVDDPTFAFFTDRGDRDTQVVRRVGATATLFAFTGRYGGLGMPLPILHRWFGQANAHVVYVRDPSDRTYNEGIPSLAPNRAGTIVALRAIVDQLGSEYVAFYANSTGGYGALLYALELPAAAVLAFGAVTEISLAMLQTRIGDRKAWSALPALAPMYRAASRRPAVHLVYGSSNREDAASALGFDGIPGVTLDAVPSCSGHDSAVHVLGEGRMGELLSKLLGRSTTEASERAADGAPT